MDARAYQLAWPAGTTLYEVDQPHVLDHKTRKRAGASLAATDARRAGRPACRKIFWSRRRGVPLLIRGRSADLTEHRARISLERQVSQRKDAHGLFACIDDQKAPNRFL